MTPGTPRAWPAVRIRLSALDAESSDALPAEERLLLQLDDLAPTAIQSLERGEWLVHFPEEPDMESVAAALGSEFGEHAGCSLEWLPDEDWAARTQAELKAVTVDRIIVAPPWDRPQARPGQFVVEIEPSTGFGTGHHQSTRLCLQALQRECRAGLSVLDIGTGSGVLAIAAALLGASPVTAIDIDEDAIRSARENVARNGVEGRIEVVQQGLDVSRHQAALVVANLTADVVCHLASALVASVFPGGRLVVSGIMTSQVALVVESLAPLVPVHTDEEEGWVAVAFAK